MGHLFGPLILKVRKLRPREVYKFALGYTALGPEPRFPLVQRSFIKFYHFHNYLIEFVQHTY